MDTKLLQKIAIGLICLSILVLIGLSIYQHQLLKKMSQGVNQEMTTSNESTGSVASEAGGTVQKDTGVVGQGKERNINDIEDLKAQLDETEAELDMAQQQYSDEVARQEELKERQIELQKQYATDPAMQNMRRSSMRSYLDTQYADLFQELNLSPEELEKFKDIYIDRTMALSELSPDIMSATTKEQKADLQKRVADIREEYETKFKELLGTDYETYNDYTEMATTRSVIDGFKESLSPDDQLTKDQEKAITEIMYKEQMQVFAEMGYDPRKELEFESDVKEGAVDGQLKNMEKIHLRSIENSKGVLTASQLEQYQNYLKNQREMTEMALKLSNQ